MAQWPLDFGTPTCIRVCIIFTGLFYKREVRSSFIQLAGVPDASEPFLVVKSVAQGSPASQAVMFPLQLE